MHEIYSNCAFKQNDTAPVMLGSLALRQTFLRLDIIKNFDLLDILCPFSLFNQIFKILQSLTFIVDRTIDIICILKEEEDYENTIGLIREFGNLTGLHEHDFSTIIKSEQEALFVCSSCNSVTVQDVVEPLLQIRVFSVKVQGRPK
jgi:hypothetical protein